MDLLIFAQTAFGLYVVSFLSIVLRIILSLLFFIKKIRVPRFYSILFLIGVVSWTWIVYFNKDGFFYSLLG